MIRTKINDCELILLVGGDDDLETVDNLDAEVILQDGSRWSATVLTLAAVARIMKKWEASGECRNGTYFSCPDLLIVQKGGIAFIRSLFVDLITSGEVRNTLTRLSESEFSPEDCSFPTDGRS